MNEKMSGQPGRSGRRRKPLADLVLTGRYRPDRHGPLPAAGTPLPAITGPEWTPAAEDLAGLGEAGKRFVAAMTTTFTFDLPEGVLLLEAAHCVEALAQWRPKSATDA